LAILGSYRRLQEHDYFDRPPTKGIYVLVDYDLKGAPPIDPHSIVAYWDYKRHTNTQVVQNGRKKTGDFNGKVIKGQLSRLKNGKTIGAWFHLISNTQCKSALSTLLFNRGFGNRLYEETCKRCVNAYVTP
jgi:hypothetical protein